MNTQKWEKIRSKVKSRFVWVNGMLIWGAYNSNPVVCDDGDRATIE